MRIEFITWFFSITTLAIFCFITIPVHSQCLEDQKSLLLQLKNSLQFNPNSSVKLVNWARTNDCCQWNGVTCDHSGRVTGLDLNNETISGGLNNSSSLFRLKFLESLNLAYNSFNGPIPNSLANLSQLVYLDLSFNNFTGPVPSTYFEGLSNLVHINLGYNSFHGSIPSSLCSLPSMQKIWLPHNNFSGSMPSFQGSKNLTSIDLSYNALTGPVPSIFFEGLSNLANINLCFNSFNGSIPSSLFSFPSLPRIDFSWNQFSELSEFLPNKSLSALDTLLLDHNKIQGPIPSYFFDIQSLRYLDLSFNNFSGTIQLESFHRLQNLEALFLSDNSLSVNASISDSSLSSFPQLAILRLASCKLQEFPPLMKLPLVDLDLSVNQISGVIPNWVWNIGDRSVMNLGYGSFGLLNLSCNLLVGLQPKDDILPIFIDLHSNQLCGEIPIPPEHSSYVDYSRNNFSSSIPAGIGNRIRTAWYFSLSHNMLSGPIPPSICNGTDLEILDLSNNRFTDTIPQCLIDTSTTTLSFLNLQNNQLTGKITGTFPGGCALRSLALYGNCLEGQVPKSLVNCANVEVINLGTNKLNGNFPCFLANLSNLHILILQSNKLQGNIHCIGMHSNMWPKLQIIDLASNNFSGILPPKFFSQRKAMMDVGNAQPYLNQLSYKYSIGRYYEDSVTLHNKGFEMELVKILAIFIAIDFSNNNFKGEIPHTVGDLKSLNVLNLSHNALTGSIPSSLGNLSKLESLDLSWNKLGGSIPVTLARLTFLAFLNLSYNQLFGMIPTGTQLQSFPNTSYERNKGLWGPPLTAIKAEPAPPPTLNGTQSYTEEDEINWVYIITTLGYTVGFGVVVVPLLYSKRWRQRYYKPLDRAIVRILYHQEQRARHERRRDNINQLRRRMHH